MVACEYAAAKFGLVPAGDEAQALCRMVVACIHDYVGEGCVLSFTVT